MTLTASNVSGDGGNMASTRDSQDALRRMPRLSGGGKATQGKDEIHTEMRATTGARHDTATRTRIGTRTK